MAMLPHSSCYEKLSAGNAIPHIERFYPGFIYENLLHLGGEQSWWNQLEFAFFVPRSAVLFRLPSTLTRKYKWRKKQLVVVQAQQPTAKETALTYDRAIVKH